jgi:hypothetical protein
VPIEVPPENPQTLRMTVDVARAATPIAGVIYANGDSHPFEGWLALASTMQRLAEPQDGASE